MQKFVLFKLKENGLLLLAHKTGRSVSLHLLVEYHMNDLFLLTFSPIYFYKVFIQLEQ